MRILYATRRPQYPFLSAEGAQRSIWELLRTVQRSGAAQVRALSGSTRGKDRALALPPRSDWDALGVRSVEGSATDATLDVGYPLRVAEVMEAFDGEVEGFRPDVVVTFGDLAPQLMTIARRRRLPVVLLFRNAEYLLSAGEGEGARQMDRLRRLLDDRVRLAGNSAFVCRRIEEVYGVRAALVPVAVDVSRFIGPWNRDGFVTFVNPAWEKGASIFVELATRVPERRFLVVEGWELEDGYRRALLERLARMPNVEFRTRLPSIAPVLAETTLLIVPSVWEEAYGRVVIEAHARGIPALVSARGGLPEVLSEGGAVIDDYTNPDAWAAAVRAFFADPTLQERWSAAARRNLERAKHDLERSAAALIQLCASLVS